MKHTTLPIFTEEDIYILENVDRELLMSSIEFLKSYQEVMWINNDTGEIVSESKLKGCKLRIQPRPIYPKELIKMGSMFHEILSNKYDMRVDLKKAGFFTKNSLSSCFLGTTYSPSLIASLICDSFERERFCDGLFGFGVEKNIYLKMLLHLADLVHYYDYLRSCKTVV